MKTFFSALRELGHSKAEVEMGIDQLLKGHLIDSDFLELGEILKDESLKKYFLTEKGSDTIYTIFHYGKITRINMARVKTICFLLIVKV